MAGRKKRAPRRKPFDPTTLFEERRWPLPDPYPTLRSNLDAVKSGKKGMSYFLYGRSQLDRDPEIAELLELAFSRGLAIVLHNKNVEGLSRRQQSVETYIARPDQLWRVPAHIALWESTFEVGPWTYASEALQGLLFGYDEKQRREWIANLRQRTSAFGCATVYTMLDRDRKAAVDELGGRCFGSSSVLDGLEFFARVGTTKADASKRVPRGFTLARAGLRWPMYLAIWPRNEHESKKVERPRAIPKKLVKEFNAALTTNVQFFTAKGWV